MTGTGFYLGLLGRAGVFALVLWLDVHPEYSCAVDLSSAARVSMFLFHQIACPVLILIVYFQVCLWATNTRSTFTNIHTRVYQLHLYMYAYIHTHEYEVILSIYTTSSYSDFLLHYSEQRSSSTTLL